MPLFSSAKVLTSAQIKLRTRFDGVSNPIQYEDTPQLQTTTLGVVGYPGELSFGNYMYEHWDTVQIDLAKSHGILEYKVDTTGGELVSRYLLHELTIARPIGFAGVPHKSEVK